MDDTRRYPLLVAKTLPILIAAMRAAFLKACEAPQVRDAGDGMMAIVAEKILQLAEAGETNADRLCTGALRRLLQ